MIEINGKSYELVIQRKRNRNIYLRVEDGVLKVTCPYFVPKYEVLAFIESRRKWIEAVDQKRKDNSKLYVNDTIFYRGKLYALNISYGNKYLRVDDDTIYIKCRSTDTKSALKVFYELSKHTLLKEIHELEPKYLTILKDYGYYQKPEYNIKHLTSMWGVCYNKKNMINISDRLIHYEKKYLEATLWHELLHFVIPNHSKRFHEVLSLHMPEYEEIMKSLR